MTFSTAPRLLHLHRKAGNGKPNSVSTTASPKIGKTNICNHAHPICDSLLQCPSMSKITKRYGSFHPCARIKQSFSLLAASAHAHNPCTTTLQTRTAGKILSVGCLEQSYITDQSLGAAAWDKSVSLFEQRLQKPCLMTSMCTLELA